MRTILYLLITIFITSCGGSGSESEPENTGEDQLVPVVRGVVIDRNYNGVSGSDIEINFIDTGTTLETISKENGDFEFDSVPVEGSFIITALHSDGRSGSSSGAITSNESELETPIFLMDGGSGKISGVVVDEGDIPISSAVVNVSFDETKFSVTSVADENGEFKFEELPLDGVFTIFSSNSDSSYGTYTEFLTSSQSIVFDAKIVVASLDNINERMENSDFSGGTLEGWEVEGDSQVVVRDTIFESPIVSNAALATSARTASKVACTPPTYSAVVSTSGDENSLGKISQNFVVNPGEDTLVGKMKFLSNEYPTYYGSEFNDSYHLSLITPDGTKILSKGNLNSSTWGSGAGGYSGATEEINFSADVSKYAGKTVSLVGEVRDIGDSVVDSALALSDMRIVNKDNRNYAASGFLNGNASESYSLGMVVWITVENINVLGTTVTIYPRVGTNNLTPQGAIVLPMMKHTFRFDYWGNEPMGWTFDFRTESDVLLANYRVESTWVEGMPPNPCR